MLFNLLLKNRYLFCKSFSALKTMEKNDGVIVAVCQTTCTSDKNKNLRTVINLVEQAKKLQAKMIFFPEATDFMSLCPEEAIDLAETFDGHLMSTYKSLAKHNEMWISIGGFHEIVPELGRIHTKTFNTHCLINDKGNLVGVYRKIHMFDVNIPEMNINLCESAGTVPGKSITAPIETPIGKLGMGICYDLRFPEFSTILRKLDADVLLFPSAFTNSTGEAHWEVLLRARAIENQCYVIAAAQVGRNNAKRITYGQAMIVDPWGKIIAQLPKYTDDYSEDGAIAVAKIKKEILHNVRQKMPILEHRRSDCYNLTSNNIAVPIDYNLPDTSSIKHFEFADKIIPLDTIFYETFHSVAFTNLRCVLPGHVLIATKRKVSKLTDLNPEEQADLMQASIKVERLMEMIRNTNSTSVVCQDGVDAGQTVPHVHIHIIPRVPNDFQRNDEIYDALANHDKRDAEIPPRELEEMITEAQYLRVALRNMPS